MSSKTIITIIKKFLDENDKITKKEFLKVVSDAFDDNKPTVKAKTLKLKCKNKDESKNNEEEKNSEIMNKKIKKDNIKNDDEKPKRKLSEYQQFAKEQLAFLKAREDSKNNGEKLKQKDLLKLVGKRWKLKKEGIDEDEWDTKIEEIEDE